MVVLFLGVVGTAPSARKPCLQMFCARSKVAAAQGAAGGEQ